MDASERGAMMLVRVVAIALIGFGLAELVPAAAQLLKGGTGILPVVLRAIPAILGVAMLVKAKAVAEWLDDLLDG